MPPALVGRHTRHRAQRSRRRLAPLTARSSPGSGHGHRRRSAPHRFEPEGWDRTRCCRQRSRRARGRQATSVALHPRHPRGGYLLVPPHERQSRRRRRRSQGARQRVGRALRPRAGCMRDAHDSARHALDATSLGRWRQARPAHHRTGTTLWWRRGRSASRARNASCSPTKGSRSRTCSSTTARSRRCSSRTCATGRSR